MANYESSLMEPNEVGEFCKLCNEEGYKIISCVGLADSGQVLMIIDRPKPFLKKVEEKTEEEEE
jgi:hypothetical protein